jgi:hypothetical protein
MNVQLFYQTVKNIVNDFGMFFSKVQEISDIFDG